MDWKLLAFFQVYFLNFVYSLSPTEAWTDEDDPVENDIFLESMGTTYGRIKNQEQDFKLQRVGHMHLLCYAISYLFWQYVEFIVLELEWEKASLGI